jgi:xanthine dehydrogenase large subunit
VSDAGETVCVGTAAPHESAHLHVSGEARYTDDIALPAVALHAAIGTSERAHARVRGMDLAAVKAAPGVVLVLCAADVPGANNHGPVVHDDPIFATERVEYVGQSLFAVIADSVDAARRAVRLARIDYEELPPILDVATALAQGSLLMPSKTLRRGEPEQRLAAATHRLQDGLALGGQDHFYLEGQIAIALPGEDNTMQVLCSTQHPSEVQRLVAETLAVHAKDVVVECRRMGGAFGGKETQAALFACVAAIAAQRLGVAVKCRADRDADMQITGKRHPFEIGYDVGFDAQGRIEGLRLVLAANCGRSTDLSDAVNGRAMFHADNCYYLADVEIVSHRCKTNQSSHTAFRGFGGPQGMLAIEAVIDAIARHLGKDPLDIRRINFYGEAGRNVTPYGMLVEDNILQRLAAELETRCAYRARRERIDVFNRDSAVLRRGIALTPVKFGISFTATHMNQGGALVHIYTDGTILLNHGGTEMGQGLHTKVAQVVAEEFQVDLARIRVNATDTSKVPNTSATAGSASSDLNGRAAQAAARTIKQRLIEFGAGIYAVAPAEVVFRNGRVQFGTVAEIAFEQLVWEAYLARVSLSATGFYKTPKIGYDPCTMRGRPFYYFCYGAAVAEVEIDTLTGEFKLRRVDILHDVGRSLNPAIDLGQVEGGFLQGVGWLTSEELYWDAAGRLLTHAPSTYKIPTASDWPEEFHVELLAWSENREDNLYRSKAVGEPPLMLAMSVLSAIRDAIGSLAEGPLPRLDAPATPERILFAVEAMRGRR